MIDFLTNIPSLIVIAVVGSVATALLGILLQAYSKSRYSIEIIMGFYALSVLLIVIGTPAAALLSGITFGEIVSLLFALFFFGSLALVALVALGIVLFILGSVFVPIR